MNGENLTQWASFRANQLKPSTAEKEIHQQRQSDVNQVEIMLRAKANGMIPLKSLLDILASEELIAAGRADKLTDAKTRTRVDFELYGLYHILIRKAQSAIRDGKLQVRTLTAPHPVINEEPGVRAWCSENHTLKGIHEAAPDGRIVLKIEDARNWLNSQGIEIPNWLKAYEPFSEIETKRGKRDRQLEVVLSIIREKGWEQDQIPDGGKAEIKNICLADHKSLFTDAGFEHFWKKCDQIKMQNHDKFVSR